MDSIPLSKRFYYAYQGALYAFTRWTTSHRLLGMRFRTLVMLASLALIVAAWVQRWSGWALGLTLALFIYLLFVYWRAGRAGYFRFVPDKTSTLPTGNLNRLPPNEHVPVLVTGVVSVQSRAASVLLHPAEYWQVPLGDHIVMVQQGPDRFLYQFFDGESLQQVRHGWLIYGLRPHPALEVAFLTAWGPEFNTPTFYLFGNSDNRTERKRRALYFSFEDAQTERIVWHNIIGDARRVRERGTGDNGSA